MILSWTLRSLIASFKSSVHCAHMHAPFRGKRSVREGLHVELRETLERSDGGRFHIVLLLCVRRRACDMNSLPRCFSTKSPTKKQKSISSSADLSVVVTPIGRAPFEKEIKGGASDGQFFVIVGALAYIFSI